VPEWNTISISGYHMREAGSTAVQEVAFTLANGLTYVRAALDAGLGVDDFAPRVSFFFNAHNDFLEEVAKFRAARRMWARIMREDFHAKNPRSWMLRFHTQTAGSTLTAQQPDVNLVRVTLQALAAVLGGTQSLHTNSRDEALALPTEASALIALRTQQMIAHESGVPNVVDPLGGSYFIENLTDRLEQEALEYIRRIDAMGGVLRAIETGFIQREIQQAAYEHQRGIEAIAPFGPLVRDPGRAAGGRENLIRLLRVWEPRMRLLHMAPEFYKASRRHLCDPPYLWVHGGISPIRAPCHPQPLDPPAEVREIVRPFCG